MRAGMHWGEDLILTDINLMRFCKGVALTYVEVLCLER